MMKMAFVDRGADKNWTCFVRLYHVILSPPRELATFPYPSPAGIYKDNPEYCFNDSPPVKSYTISRRRLKMTNTANPKATSARTQAEFATIGAADCLTAIPTKDQTSTTT